MQSQCAIGKPLRRLIGLADCRQPLLLLTQPPGGPKGNNARATGSHTDIACIQGCLYQAALLAQLGVLGLELQRSSSWVKLTPWWLCPDSCGDACLGLCNSTHDCIATSLPAAHGSSKHPLTDLLEKVCCVLLPHEEQGHMILAFAVLHPAPGPLSAACWRDSSALGRCLLSGSTVGFCHGSQQL